MYHTIVSRDPITAMGRAELSADGFDEHPSRFPRTALSRAATIVRSGMIFRQRFKQGQVKPEATKEGPICMDTWR